MFFAELKRNSFSGTGGPLGARFKGHTGLGTGQPFEEIMEQFIIGQKWILTDALHGNFIGEVIEVYDDGASGIVIITDDQGNIVDTFAGSAAAFQASGEWRLIQQQAQ